MERPNHLQTGNQSASSKLTGLVIVIAIHVLAIAGLITALASDKIMKQIQDIKATVDTQVEKPKPPPPPPVDFVPPPPPAAIVPQFTTTVEAPPPRPAPPPAPPAAPAAPPARPAPPPPTQLVSIARTHTQPAYPTISQRLGEQGTTTIEVNINTEGSVTECKVVKSSGSERLDTASCDHVKSRWRWQPPTSEGKPVAATTRINIVWNLKDAQ